MTTITRRDWLTLSLAGAVHATTGGLTPVLAAADKAPLTIVIWGGPYMDGLRPEISAFTQNTGIPINVELHAGGAVAVIARIKADLPAVKRDIVAAADPIFLAMAREGWLEEITPEKLPRMNELLPLSKITDSRGKVIALAWTIGESGWFYRQDLVPRDLQPIMKFDQLLDPRLKGRVYIPPPIGGFGGVQISLALARGGNEHNMKPGWDAMLALAERGQIGGLPKSDSEYYQAISSGDAWVMFGSMATAAVLSSSNVPIERVRSENLKSRVLREGFSVIRGPRSEEAFEWMRFFYTPQNIGGLTNATKQPPSDPLAPVSPGVAKFNLSTAEQKRFAFVPDYEYVATTLNEWQKYFETEILPKIRT